MKQSQGKLNQADYEYYTNSYQDHEDCGYVGFTKLFVVMMVSSANQWNYTKSQIMFKILSRYVDDRS